MILVLADSSLFDFLSFRVIAFFCILTFIELEVILLLALFILP